ncbi:MAG: hypothetical protein ACJAZF_004476 [Granulosicoccus sp.]|jgi:hypothetical protein
MKTFNIIDTALLVLLAAGFIGALKVSIANFSGSSCPQVGIIPICYVVLVAYGLMITSVMIRHNGCKHYFFCAGWGTAFVIALLGSIAEIMSGGGVCPTSGGGGIRGVSNGSVPLCYASLAMLVVILVLFLMGPYKRACDLHNNKDTVSEK